MQQSIPNQEPNDAMDRMRRSAGGRTLQWSASHVLRLIGHLDCSAQARRECEVNGENPGARSGAVCETLREGCRSKYLEELPDYVRRGEWLPDLKELQNYLTKGNGE